MKKSLMISVLLLIAVCVSAQDIVSQDSVAKDTQQVEADGTISQVKVLEPSTFKSLDDEAIRLVNAMPKWLPALKNGKPVTMKTTLPIGFGVK